MGKKSIFLPSIFAAFLFLIFTVFRCFVPSIAALEQAEKPYKQIAESADFEQIDGIVDSYVSWYIGKRVAGASVAILKDGKTILAKGYGFADLDNQISATSDTIYEYGSISKLFVWVAAMQLYEDGKLDLHEDIRTYLPAGFQVSIKQNQEVTMLDLMNHTAGFDSGYRPDEPGSSLGDAVSRYDSFQCFEQGEVVAYSNYGANLAAFVIEEISGQTFSSYVQEHILDALGMQSFYSDFSKVGIENGVFPEDIGPLKAKGYARESCVHEGDFQEVSWYNSGWLYASGALNGNAPDLLKFANALLDDSNHVLFKNPSTLQEMLSLSYIAKEDDTLFSNYHGFGGSNGNFDGLGHAGNTYGFSTRLIINPSPNIASRCIDK